MLSKIKIFKMLLTIIILTTIWIIALSFMGYCIHSANKAIKGGLPKEQYILLIKIDSFFVAEAGLGNPFKKQSGHNNIYQGDEIGHDSGHNTKNFNYWCLHFKKK
jgi:hypothetical protein